MKKASRTLLGLALFASLAGCDDYLTTQPQTIITDDQIWSDGALILNVIADLYDRLPMHQGLEQDNLVQGNGGGPWLEFTAYDEALYSGVTAGYQIRNSLLTYDYDRWIAIGANENVWGNSYELIRDVNLALDRIAEGTLGAGQKAQLSAELRFIRALTYFELAKRAGGVPIVTEQLVYDFSGDPAPLQRPRDSEVAVYDFIASEVDAIASTLGNEGSRTRANRYTALALKSRAMLYAGSIARYGLVSLPGGEVGIPAALADGYFEKSLNASREIIESGAYSLVQGANPAEAFTQIFLDKGNTEVILAKDYDVASGKKHFFTMQAYPQSIQHQQFANWGGGAISASLNLVESYDYLDGSSGELRGVGDGSGNPSDWIFYENPEDIFEGKDGRLFGTVMTPGSTFAGEPLRFQAGVYIYQPDGSYVREGGVKGSTFSDGGTLTGLDGPISGEVYTSVTGFYIRKYMDPSAAGAQATGTDTWWVLFRLGEIYMNAAEAALELSLTGEALGYLNTVKERAGFPANSVSSASLSDIQEERWNELAFEDHRVWDLKRWRTAHLVWDGSSSSADVYALYPYRIVGGPNNNRYVFDRIPSPAQTAPRFFRMGNYYSEIPDDVISGNPLLVRNPFH